VGVTPVKSYVLSVGFHIPGDEIETVDFKSDRSLLDADIIVFAPNLESYSIDEYFRGKVTLTEDDSAHLNRDIAHWKGEIKIALEAGKTVFLFMLESQDVYVYTGDKQYSGTGRNTRTTSMVTSLDPYSSVPIAGLQHIVRKRGDRIATTNDLGVLSTYWQAFSQFSMYQVYLDKPVGTPALVTQTGNRMIGGIVRTKELGTLVLLPPPDFSRLIKDRAKQIEERDNASAAPTVSNAKAQKADYTRKAHTSIGKQFMGFIVEIDKTLREHPDTTPTPEWATGTDYVLQGEMTLRAQIEGLEARIVELQDEKNDIQSRATQAANLRGLLFETGKPLEAAIIEALQIMGFSAQRFKDHESEFDILFTDPEGARYIGEAEGKNDKAVNIDKLAQLERNIQEDFEKRESNEYAKPVLFGNAFRLLSPEKRGDYFTPKCLTGARRVGAALVRTPDLFTVVKYLKENENLSFQALCRRAIRDTAGTIVGFPKLPIGIPYQGTTT
jgi:hypothetical protein